VQDSYIVKLTDKHGSREALTSHVRSMEATFQNYNTTWVYEGLAEHGFPAYSATLSQSTVQHLLSLEEVEYVEQDMVVEAIQQCADNPEGPVQSGATWGIARTTNCKGRDNCDTKTVCTSNCDYYYDETLHFNRATVYIMDTGVNCINDDFQKKDQGSCSCGFTAISGVQCNSQTSTDGNGHGTHCASTAAGAIYGVAKNADIVNVQVLSASGSGSTSGVIAGVDYVAANAVPRSVGSMSLGGGASSSLDAAVNACSRSGTLVVVAAGNDNRDACSYSPARATDAITVGSTDNKDSRSSFSNYGTCVDVFAPGSSITAAWIPSATSTTTISGTSMACPHVAGMAAKLLSLEGNEPTPTELARDLYNAGTLGTLSNVGNGSPNLMAYAMCNDS
jgi:serine protease